MKIYTRTGDNGETGLPRGLRVSKSHAVVGACGDIDEANSHLGCAISIASDNATLNEVRGWLSRIQSQLFDLGSHVASSTGERAEEVSIPVTEEYIETLEAWIDQCQSRLEPLKHFILPGGSRFASHLHLSRTVCRRAERSIVRLIESGVTTDLSRDLVYLNRLGDLLFVLAREANRVEGHPETRWMGKS